MGCGRGFAFILGSLCGVYVAQHYRVPRIGDWAHSCCVRAREVEQAYRRPDDFHECWMRGKYHERNYHRPENFYGNEGGEEQNNEAVHPSINTLDPNEEPFHYKVVQKKNNVVQPRWVRPRDPINFNPNEHGQE